MTAITVLGDLAHGTLQSWDFSGTGPAARQARVRGSASNPRVLQRAVRYHPSWRSRGTPRRWCICMNLNDLAGFHGVAWNVLSFTSE
jgi:hypothetical protein